jgi:outer membrane protein assembly factor BamB
VRCLAIVFVLISLLVVGSAQADLLVTSPGGVHQFDAQTGELLDVWEVPPGANLIGGVTVGPDGNVYVGDQATLSVIRYDGASGTLIDTFVQPGSGGMTGVKDLSFGPDGNLYVSNDYNIFRFDGSMNPSASVRTNPEAGSATSAQLGRECVYAHEDAERTAWNGERDSPSLSSDLHGHGFPGRA